MAEPRLITAAAAVSVLREIVTPEKYGAVGDGVADDTAAMQKWAADANPHKAFERHYKVSAELDLSSASRVDGDGEITGTHDAGHVVAMRGALVELGTATGAQGSNRVTCSSTTGFETGDIVVLWQPDEFSFSAWRDYYHDGDVAYVRDIDGSDLILDRNLSATFAAAGGAVSATKLYRMDRAALVQWAGGTVRSLGQANPVLLRRAAGASIDVAALGGGGHSMSVDQCFATEIDGRTNCTAPVIGTQYGLVVSNSNQLEISGVHAGTQHGLVGGGGSGPGAIPCRNVTVRNANLSSETNSAGDSHGNCERWSWIDCTARSDSGGAFNLGGGDIAIVRPVFDAMTGFYFPEMTGGGYTIDRPRGVVQSDANGNLIDLGTSSTFGIRLAKRRSVLRFHAMEIEFAVAQTAVYAAWIRNRGGQHPLDVIFDGRSMMRNDARAKFARVDNVGGTVSSDRMIFEGMDGSPAYDSGTGNAGAFVLVNGYENATRVVR